MFEAWILNRKKKTRKKRGKFLRDLELLQRECNKKEITKEEILEREKKFPPSILIVRLIFYSLKTKLQTESWKKKIIRN